MMEKVQVLWVDSPSSLGNPSEQHVSAHEIQELLTDRYDELDVRLVDVKRGEDGGQLRNDCVATVLVLAVADTKLDNANARIVNQLLKDRQSVFLVLNGLTDGNIVRFGISKLHANNVVVYDLDNYIYKKGDVGKFDMLCYYIESKLGAIFNDYPVDNFAILLQQRRDAEVKQEKRSWTLLLLSLVVVVVLAVVFILVGYTTNAAKEVELVSLDEATADAKVSSKQLSNRLAELETQYITLGALLEDREFYSNSLQDDYITLILGLGDLELTEWDFESEQYFMTKRLQEVNETTIQLCNMLGSALGTTGSESEDLAQWAEFVSYCEDLHVLQTCNATVQGDGTCNGRNNYHDCNWDGGDCCPVSSVQFSSVRPTNTLN